MWCLKPNVVLYKTSRRKTMLKKGKTDHPGPPLDTPVPPLDLPKLLNSPKDPTVTPKEAQYHPSTGHISCRRSQNDQIFPVIPTIAQYSLAPTGALLTLWCSLYWLEWTNYHLSACSLQYLVVLTPQKYLTECADALYNLFSKNIINKLFSVMTSPNIGQYLMWLAINNKETSAKISVLVTIFVMQMLIVAKFVKSGPTKLSMKFACHQE